MAAAAARLVHFRSANNHNRVMVMRRFSIDKALRPRSRLAAHHANRIEFVHCLCFGNYDRHAAERLAAEIGIQPGDNNPNTAIRQVIDQLYDAVIKKLRLVNSDDGCIGR
jgi:hypothetical protein